MYNVYKKTSFHLDLWLNDLPFTLTEAGKGSIDVVILDPHGRKDTIRPSISPVPGKEGTYLVEYIAMEQGLHSINIMFAGQQIPKSPYGVNVSPGKRHCWQLVTPVAIVHVVLLLIKVSTEFYLILNHPIVDWNLYLIKQKKQHCCMCISFCKFKSKKSYMNRNDLSACILSPNNCTFFTASNAKMCYATGRGIQPKGVRVNENADFKVHTKGAGSAEVKVHIIGPGEILQLEQHVVLL